MGGGYLDYFSKLSLSHILSLSSTPFFSLNAREDLTVLVGGGGIREKETEDAEGGDYQQKKVKRKESQLSG